MEPLALALGANLGNRLANLRQALHRLEVLGTVLKRSDVFETEPWGVAEQPRFLNACLLMKTDLDPEALLTAVKGIERDMGRRETVRWGARNIDVDILLCGALLYESPHLQIPHARLADREFVLVPLAQILPDWRHPALGRTVMDMARAQASNCPPLRIAAL